MVPRVGYAGGREVGVRRCLWGNRIGLISRAGWYFCGQRYLKRWQWGTKVGVWAPQ